ncbi:BrnA antitoxin family protein [Kerstersia gyiorum]|uniref:BrnA antitoxin family protein n=1 Tax=Kerstersia gyiorum TaxID=206506 RepID=UPI00214FB020|nr:BrnA antitoxin family protein [Kerstersia gyiorum]MCR4158798.1 BrnA antitoxin family protein [Kerstersia gyiorum]
MPKLKTGHISPTPDEDAAISRGIAADPDTYELGEGEFKRLKRMGRPRSVEPKVAVTIRYDREVIEAFKAGGPGWQTRMNEALKRVVSSGRS